VALYHGAPPNTSLQSRFGVDLGASVPVEAEGPSKHLGTPRPRSSQGARVLAVHWLLNREGRNWPRLVPCWVGPICGIIRSVGVRVVLAGARWATQRIWLCPPPEIRIVIPRAKLDEPGRVEIARRIAPAIRHGAALRGLVAPGVGAIAMADRRPRVIDHRHNRAQAILKVVPESPLQRDLGGNRSPSPLALAQRLGLIDEC
jgi:hypothetical protein